MGAAALLSAGRCGNLKTEHQPRAHVCYLTFTCHTARVACYAGGELHAVRVAPTVCAQDRCDTLSGQQLAGPLYAFKENSASQFQTTPLLSQKSG